MLTKSSGLLLVASAAVITVIIVAFTALAPPNLGTATTSQGPTLNNSSGKTSNATTSSSLTSIVSTTSTTSSTTSTTTTSSTMSSTTSTRSATSTTSSTSTSPIVYVMIPLGVGDNESLNFQPSSITVVIGVNNTIVWSDMDAVQHTVTSMTVPQGAAKFDSGIMNQGQTFTLTLTVPGTYKFYCTIHPTWMRGTIIVRK